jgi:pyruvate dehydrogenase E1 component alpha subunit
LLERQIATAERLAVIEKEVEAEIRRAVEFAKNSPYPDEPTALQDIYA